MEGKEVPDLGRNTAKDGWWTHMLFKGEVWSGYNEGSWREMNRDEWVGKRCWESNS